MDSELFALIVTISVPLVAPIIKRLLDYLLPEGHRLRIVDRYAVPNDDDDDDGPVE